MRILMGMIMGILAVVYVTSLYGQGWFQLLHAERDAVPAGGVETGPPSLPDQPDSEPTVSAEQPAARAVGDAAPNPATSAEVTVAVDPAGDEARQWASYSAHSLHLPAAGDFPWRNCFRRSAAAYRLPESLLLAVARGESGFDASARSEREAIGVMQIRWPLTANHLGLMREQQLYNPCTNIDAGARYLRELLDRYAGDYHLAVSAYNYGPTRVRPGSVPGPAREYSGYILRQLQAVLGGSPLPTGSPEHAPERDVAGRTLLLRFNHGWHARAFEQYLSETAPELTLSTRALALGEHAVYLSWNSAGEYRRALDIIDSRGLLPASGRAGQPATSQEQSHEF